MPQDKTTGAMGNKFGRETAPFIAKALGAVLTRKGSNEASLDGKRIVIKCARMKTSSVGVSYKMLEHLDSVFGAFQKEDGSFEILSLPANVYRQHMVPTRSLGMSNGRVGIVAKKVFYELGRQVSRTGIQRYL